MRRGFLTICITLVVATGVFAEVGSESPWSLQLAPLVAVPVTSGSFGPNELFDLAFGGQLLAQYRFSGNDFWSARLAFDYCSSGLLPVEGIDVVGQLTQTGLWAGGQAQIDLATNLKLAGNADFGYALGVLTSGTSATYPMLRAGGGIEWRVLPSVSVGAGAMLAYRFGLYSAVETQLSIEWNLPEGQNATLRLLDLGAPTVKNVFPILRAYYDSVPLGTVRITNTSKQTAENIQVSFLLRQYMDAPKDCADIARLEPGQSVEVPLFALFNDNILAITEATKSTAEILVTYGTDGSKSKSATVLVYDRNALTWDDDRKAAAFVSSKDPWVLDLVGNTISAVKDAQNKEVAKNMQVAMALHEMLRLFGLGYQLSPNRPTGQTWQASTVDSLKFPRQTLSYRAGDCADLSVLYASCLEAAGIETAFVTVPGHIFMAIDLGLSAADVTQRRLDKAELIEVNGKFWLPIETTLRSQSFLEVWRKAALQWREAKAKSAAGFFPVHEAWQTFAPVGLPADGSSVVVPANAAVLKAFRTELEKAVSAELQRRQEALGAEPKAGQNAKWHNDLGVLKAKYGRYAEATTAFQSSAKAGYAPALTNLGTIAYLNGDYNAALTSYQQAFQLAPDNPKLLANLVRAAANLGKADLVATNLQVLRKLDPSLAESLATLNVTGENGSRAAQVTDEVSWF